MYMNSNKKSISILLTSAFVLFNIQSIHAADKQYHKYIERFIHDVKSRNIDGMSKYFTFPFTRQSPIPSIKSKKELKHRFHELFDTKLIQSITSSDLNNDWEEMGWRGIMLNNGMIWMDYDGRILAINYQSQLEKQRSIFLIKKDKLWLYKSLRNFDKPILNWETKKFKIRVDLLDQKRYRYASWGINKKYSDEPDLVLNNGQLIFQGSGGNHHYSFKTGKYSYIISVNKLVKGPSPIGELDVYKEKKLLLHDEVIKEINN